MPFHRARIAFPTALAALALQGCIHGPAPLAPPPARRLASDLNSEAAAYGPAPAAVDRVLRDLLEGKQCGGDYPYSVLLSEIILVRRSTAPTKPEFYYFKCGYKEIYGEASIVTYVARGTVDMGTRQVELTDLDFDTRTGPGSRIVPTTADATSASDHIHRGTRSVRPRCEVS